jgi:transposase
LTDIASSKLCHCCGWQNRALTLKDRTWLCQGCDTVHDRDENAAINLEIYAVRHIAVSSTVTACWRWPSSQDGGETSPGEAGNQRPTRKCLYIRKFV